MIPPTINFASIDRSDRARSVYSGIDELADSIDELGLIQPLVLTAVKSDTAKQVEALGGEPVFEGFRLNAGGRRSAALDLLLADGRWDGTLYHGASSTPGKPGFVVREGEATDDLTNTLVELAENLDREDMLWQDETKLVVKAYRLMERQFALRGDAMPDLRTASVAFKCGYNDLRCALLVHDELTKNPDRFASATNIRGAYQIILNENKKFVEALAAKHVTSVSTMAPSPILENALRTGEIDVSPKAATVVNLSSRFHHVDGLEFMRRLPSASFDHILTDPDYGIPAETIEAGGSGNRASNFGNAATGVAQKSVEQTLDELNEFLLLAFRVVRSTVIMFYDLRHHEKIHAMADAAGFVGQDWPITWHKPDYNSNASASFNTTKDQEWAAIFRKPGVGLAKVAEKSVWSIPGGQGIAARKFGHPFAKPIDLWLRALRLVAYPGQSILDPFAGSCSSLASVIQFGAEPTGCEVQLEHYNRGLLNLRDKYIEVLGPSTQFI